MKKTFISFIVVVMLLLSVINCSADEIAQNVLSDSSPHCVLATVSDIDDNYVYAELYNTVADAEHAESSLPKILKIKKFRYSYCKEHADKYNSPKIGDNIFVTLAQEGSVYSVTHAAYKTDTVDERTLNFYAPVDMKGEQCMDDVVALVYFVRSNGLERNFLFDNGSVSVERSDNTRTKLYPADIKNPLPVKFIDETGKAVDETKQQDVIKVDGGNPLETLWDSYDYELVFAKRVIALGLIFAGVIFGMIVVYFMAGRKKKQ